MKTIGLLILSNVFMTFAWYGNLENKAGLPLWQAILLSWCIAFFEYCFMVPANQIGHKYYHFTGAQLKTIQEAITLTVFAVFSVLYLKEPFKWNYLAAFACIMMAVVFMFMFKK